MPSLGGIMVDDSGSFANSYAGKSTPTGPATIVPFGTSITKLDDYTGNGGAQYSQGTTARGYLAWANVILGHRFRVLGNAGVSGNTSEAMLARISTDVLALAPGFCVVESGAPNDIGNSFTLARSIAAHKSIYDTLKAAGVRVVVCTPLPYGLTDTTAVRQFIAGLRRWQIDYAREQGHLLVDWHAVLASTDGSGLWPTNWSDGVTSGRNGVHPTEPAALVMGKALAAALANEKSNYAGQWLPHSNADPYNLLANGMMTGTGGSTIPAGTTNNGLATSWSVFNNGGTSACTLAKAARTDGIAGEWQQIQATAGNADFLKIQQQNLNPGGTAFAAGDSVLAVVEFQTDADWVGGLALYLELQFYNGLGIVYDLQKPSADTGIGQAPASGVVQVIGAAVPVGATRLTVDVTFKATTGTIRFGRAGLYNLTQLAALGIAVP